MNLWLVCGLAIGITLVALGIAVILSSSGSKENHIMRRDDYDGE